MKITMLGTGNALVSEVYNTCYVLTDEEKQGTEKYFMVDAGEDETRRFFAKMRGLYEEAAQRYAGSVDMQYLSMGMSGDYPLAIAEGANIVRIGTAIYGPRDYSAKK